MPTAELRFVGIESKQAGYIRIETDGRPRFMDTKRDDLIDEAYQILEDHSLVIARYSESESRNINQHTGKPYINCYFEGAVTDGHRSESETRSRRPEPERREPRTVDANTDVLEPERREPERREPSRDVGYGYRTHPETAWRIALTSGSERAMQTLLLLPMEERDGVDFEQQKLVALGWARFYMNTPQDPPRLEPDEDEIPF